MTATPSGVPRWRRDLAVTLLLLALLLAWEFSGADLPLARLYGSADGFALRRHWVVAHLLHDGGRVLAGIALAAVVLWSAFGRAVVMARRTRWQWTGVVLLGLVAVPALKRLSRTSCPWDLAEFGGVATYVPHWVLTQLDGGPGHCFPSGHAVAAFAFLPLYFQWRDARPQLARALLLATVSLGALFGWAQLARGAHYASHTLWSAWLCWALAAAASMVLDGSRAGHHARTLAGANDAA